MKKKTVSNLLMDIGKVRDLLEEGDFEKIYKNCPLFLRVQEETRKYVKKFFASGQKAEMDFNYYDLQELSDEAYNFVKNYQQKMTFSKFDKEVEKIEVLTIEKYNDLTYKWEKTMKIDTYLRSLYKTLSYVAVGLKYFAREEKSFDKEIADTIKELL